MDAVLATLNRAHADYMREAMQAWNSQITASRADGANTDACALEAIGAAEDMVRKAKMAAELLRSELAKTMQQDGVTGFQSDNWKASLRERLPEPMVTDEKALQTAHPELWKPQPDKFQTTEMKKLARKQDLPGVTMSNGGAPVLVVSARKDG